MDVKGQRILILGDSLSHVGLDSAPSVVELSPGPVRSAAPGHVLGSLLLARGAEAIRINAKVGRSATSFLANENGTAMIQADATWRPSKVVVILGTNDTQRDLAKTEAAMITIRDAYRETGAEVWAIGPYAYVGRGAVLNAPAERVADMMQRVFAGTFIDARPITVVDSRAGDGIHFTATSAPVQGQLLAEALIAKRAMPRKMIVHVGIGFGVALAIGLIALAVSRARGRSSAPRLLGTGDDSEPDDDDDEEWFKKLHAKVQTKKAKIRSAFERSPAVIATYPDGSQQLLVISGEMQPGYEGGLRVTTFAEDGPMGHASRMSMDKIVDEIMQYSYQDFRPASDDEVMTWTTSPKFIEGSKRVAFVQAANSLSHRAHAKGNADAAHAVERRAHKLASEGKWDDATLILQQGIKDLGRAL